jgi:hypothetical protein
MLMISRNTHWREKLNEILLTEVPINQGSISADGAIVNWIAGVIRSQYIGLVREGVRIKIMDRIDLRVRWPIGEPRYFGDGEHVIAMIPAEAVRLEAGMFRRSKQRWNRWIGRIVLTESTVVGLTYTVKIHGEDWTLKGYGPVAGSGDKSKPWDVVNVVVDPQRVDLIAVGMRSWPYK